MQLLFWVLLYMGKKDSTYAESSKLFTDENTSNVTSGCVHKECVFCMGICQQVLMIPTPTLESTLT